jgi:hypothetical protein
MQNQNNAGLLAQHFLKLALLLQAGDKLDLFNQSMQDEFATILNEFEHLKNRINNGATNAIIEKSALIDIDNTTDLNELFQIDNDAIDTFLDIGLDAQDVMDEIVKDLAKGNTADL